MMIKSGRYLPDSKFDKRQLTQGMKVELEHTSSKMRAKGIAKDHLQEHPRYYIELKKMERKLKGMKR